MKILEELKNYFLITKQGLFQLGKLEDIKSTKNFQIEKKLYASTPNNKTVNIKYDSCQNELKEEENKVVSNKRK